MAVLDGQAEWLGPEAAGAVISAFPWNKKVESEKLAPLDDVAANKVG